MTHRSKHITVARLAALCLSSVLGCGGNGPSQGNGGAGMGGAGNAEPAATFTQIYDMMYPMATNARCTACHAQPPNDVANGMLQMGMDKASVYTALVGKMSMSSRCMKKTYVIPSDPDNSLLLQKLTDPPPCGSRMPLGGDQFTPAQLDMIRSWIAAGAKDD